MNTPFSRPDLSRFIQEGTDAAVSKVTFPDGTQQSTAAAAANFTAICGFISDSVNSPTAGNLQLLLDNTIFNTDTNIFTKSGNTVTVSKKGVYRFFIQVAVTNLSLHAECYVYIKVNGSEPNLDTKFPGRLNHVQPKHIFTFDATGYVVLDVDDEVTFFYYQGDVHDPDEVQTSARQVLELVSIID
mgnify:CR=1 FL=1